MIKLNAYTKEKKSVCMFSFYHFLGIINFLCNYWEKKRKDSFNDLSLFIKGLFIVSEAVFWVLGITQ